MHVRTFVTTIGLFGLSALPLACLEDAPADKGTESELPVNGSADSWRSPTDHGTLLFGVPSQAEFATEALYHAWSFSLAGSAGVSLRVVPHADNLDTVLYLYRREPGTTAWGSYVERNDDFDGNAWSGLDATLGGGEYRIMVKGYKASLRGRFDLVAQCSGEGCGQVAECPAEIESLPGSTAFGTSCVDRIRATHRVSATDATFQVLQTARCEQAEVVRRAWDYYYGYWNGLVGWSDLVWDSDEPFGFEVQLVALEGGASLVNVDYGGDEMAMTFLFDAGKNLLAWFQDNQSPTIDFYCAAPDDTDLGQPEEFCFGAFLREYATAAPDAEVAGTGTFGAVGGNAVVVAAARLYAEDLGLDTSSGTETYSYRYVRWPSAHSREAYVVDVQTGGGPEREYMFGIGETGYSDYLYYSRDDGQTDFRCLELDLD